MKKLILIILSSMPNVGWTDPLSIRSGDHDTFSRLVIEIPEGSDWEVDRTDRGYILEIPNVLDGYDSSEVFERITRERIAELIQNSSGDLEIVTQCDCFIDTFLWRPDRLVLDIIEGTPPNDIEALPIENIFRELTSLESNPTLASPESQIVVENNFLLGSAMTEDEIDRAEEVRSVEIALIEGLARAATQGFLEAAAVANPSTEPASVIKPEVLNLPDDIPLTLSPHPGVDVSTALDRDLALLGDAIKQNSDQNCLPMELFNIRDWAGNGSFHEQIAPSVAALTGEFGHESSEAYEKLAQSYIYFGFGAEAISVLSMENMSTQSRIILLELAAIIDETEDEVDSILSQASCDNAGEMWAFIVDPVPVGEEQINNIQNHFRDLPIPLRNQIAPRLARSFLQVGNVEIANLILDSFQIGDVGELHETIATRAEISSDIGNTDEIQVLSKQVQDNPRTSPDSLIRLIDLAIQEGQRPNEDDILLIASMRQEYKDAPIASELLIAEAEGRLARGEYREALELINGLTDQDTLHVLNDVYVSLSDKADIEVFLEIVFSEIPEGLSTLTENKIARRLIDVGFPNRSLDFLASTPESDNNKERQYLKAEVALAQSNYEDALNFLIGLEDERTTELRTRIQSSMGSVVIFPAEGPPVSDADGLEAETISNNDLDSQLGINSNTLTARRVILERAIESRRSVESLLNGLGDEFR